MRKRTIKRGISLLLILVLAVVFAACKPDEENAGTTEQSTQPVYETETGAETGTAMPETQAQTTEASTETPGLAKLPATKEELLAVYNQAANAGALTQNSMTQKVEAGTVGFKDTDKMMNLLAPDQAALLEKFEKQAGESAPVTLPQLNNAAVQGVTVNGTQVTFQLNEINAGQELAEGTGGYLGLVEYNRTQELVEAVKAYANVSGKVKIKNVSYSLREGKFTVQFNEDFTKIVSLHFTGKQSVQADMTYLVMTLAADVTYVLTSDYKA